MRYTIRQATNEDIDILYRIYTENMKGYVEKVYPWNPQLFRDRFASDMYQEFNDVGWAFNQVFLG